MMKLPNVDRLVMRMAGTMVLFSAAMIYFHHVYWVALTAFVGINLFQSSFTGFCPAANIFHWIGSKPGAAFDWIENPIEESKGGTSIAVETDSGLKDQKLRNQIAPAEDV